jgi:hypothetical protein
MFVTMSHVKSKRNKLIVKDRDQKGLSWHEIGAKHGITFNRARVIYLNEKARKREVPHAL